MTTTTWIIVAAGVVLAAVGVFLFLRSREPKEEEYLHFNCPQCGRKLRYKERQAGHRGACPRCSQDFTFPTRN